MEALTVIMLTMTAGIETKKKGILNSSIGELKSVKEWAIIKIMPPNQSTPYAGIVASDYPFSGELNSLIAFYRKELRGWQ